MTTVMLFYTSIKVLPAESEITARGCHTAKSGINTQKRAD